MSIVASSMTVAFGAMSDGRSMNVRAINMLDFNHSCLMDSNALFGHLVNKLQNEATGITGDLICRNSVCYFTSAVTNFKMAVL